MLEKDKCIFSIAKPAMLADLYQLDIAAWGEGAASYEFLARRIERNPNGNFVAIASDGQLVGSLWTLPTQDKPITSWLEASGSGCYEGVMDPSGTVVFGVNLSVHPKAQGGSIARRLVEHGILNIAMQERHYLRLGGRMPRYHQWCRVFTAQDYIRLYEKKGSLFYRAPDGSTHIGPKRAWLKEIAARLDATLINPIEWPLSGQEITAADLLDPEIRFFARIQMKGVAVNVVKVIPNYFNDPDSLNYGVYLEWRNPDYVGLNETILDINGSGKERK